MFFVKEFLINQLTKDLKEADSKLEEKNNSIKRLEFENNYLRMKNNILTKKLNGEKEVI